MATPSAQPARCTATTTRYTQNTARSRLQSSLAITIENADEVLEWQPEYGIIICRDHGYAIGGVAQHLRLYHIGKDIEKKAVVELFSEYVLRRPKDVPLPLPLQEPFDALGTPQKGFICKEPECERITVSRDEIRKHCNKEHDWRSSKQEREYWHQVWVQTFFTAGLQRYFTVLYDEPEASDGEAAYEGDNNIAAHATPAERSTVTAIIEDWDKLDNQEEEALQVADAKVAKTDNTGWFKRTEWTAHLAKCNLRHLSQATRLPDRNEATLKRAVELSTLLIARCVDGLPSLNRETRRWLRSAKQSEIDVRPLARLQNESSQDRYVSYMSRLICYLLRVEESSRNRLNEDSRSESIDKNNEDRDSSAERDDTDGDSNNEEEQVVKQIDVHRDARRLFPWHDDLKERVAELRVAIDTPYGEETQLRILLEVYKLLIFQHIHGNVHQSAMMHYLAVLGIDEETERLRTGNNYSYILAGVVYCVRVLGVEILLPSARRKQQTPEDDREFIVQRSTWLADGSYSVMSNMISLLAYGKALALNHTNKGTILFNHEGTALHYNNDYIELSQFRKMAQSAVSDAEDILWRDLMWTRDQDRFHIPLADLNDDIELSKRGESFISNPKNNLTGKREWILQRATAKDVGKMYRKGKWIRHRVNRYLRAIDKFKELLLFCMHVTSGQPARGSEVTSMRYRNGYLQDRNIYILFGILMSVTRYHKSQSQWDIPKVVPRFPPWRVGQLITVYLAYVRPLEAFLTVNVQGGGWTDYIWASKQGSPWETDRLTRIITRETAKRLGVRLTTHDYRHVAIAIGRKVIGDKFVSGIVEQGEQVEEPEVDEETDALEMSAGRGAEVGVRRYGVPIDMIKHLSAQAIDTFRPLSEAWHEGFLGLSSYGPQGRKRGVRAPSVGSAEELERVEQERRMAVMRSNNGIGGWGATLQRYRGWGAPATVVPSNNGWNFGGPVSSNNSRSRQEREPSTPHITQSTPYTRVQGWRDDISNQVTPWAAGHDPALHRYTPILSNTDTSGLRSSPLDAHSQAQGGPSIRQVGQVQEADVTKAVQKALGCENVRYRSDEQRRALFDIVAEDQQTPLVVVLPTGGGKSLLFMAPACLPEARMTIVVVPFRKLIDNMVDRARKCGIECVEWTENVTDPARLVFVSADKVESSFLLYAQGHCDKGRVQRIFVDECHVTFTQSDWRPRLSRLSVVRSFRVPLILLTATLPRVLEIELEFNMQLPVARYIRAPTTRAKTQYMVVKVEAGTLIEEALGLCRRKREQLEVGEKGVVYSKSRDQCERLAQELGCYHHHAGLVDDEDRLQEWLKHGGLIVATSALGTGVDYPGVVFTVHVDVPYGLIDFSQESGRAGRAGEDVDSIIVVEKGKAEQVKGGASGVDLGIMCEFITTGGCRRVVLSRYFDGLETRCGEGFARCDGCGGGISVLERRARRNALEREAVEETLDQIASDGCAVCFVIATDGATTNGWTHLGIDCTRWESDEQWAWARRAEVEQFRSWIRWDSKRGGKSHSCWKCGFSQKLCATGQSNTAPCQWAGIFAGFVKSIMMTDRGMAVIEKAGYQGERAEWKEYAAWLGQRCERRIWGELMSNAMAVVIKFIMSRKANIDEVEEEVQDAENEVLGPNHGVQDPTQDAHVHEAGEGDRVGVDGFDDELVGLLKKWQGQCVLCSNSQSHVDWRDCPHCSAEELGHMEDVFDMLQGITFEPFSGCPSCLVPFEICRSWERVSNSGPMQFVRRRGRGGCQFEGVLRNTVAGALAFRSEVQEWLYKQADGSSEVEGEGEEDARHRRQQWLGKKYVVRGFEVSGMCWLFQQWG